MVPDRPNARPERLWTRLCTIIPVLALGQLGSPVAAQDGAIADWFGAWETRWRGGGAQRDPVVG